MKRREGSAVYYVDLLWGMNVCIHLLLFWGTAKWTRKQVSAKRLWIVSAAGSCSVFTVLTPFEDWLLQPGSALLLSVVLVPAALGFYSVTLFLQQLFVFYMLSFLTAGIITGLHMMVYFQVGQGPSWMPGASLSYGFILTAVLLAAVTIHMLQTVGKNRGTKIEKTTTVILEIDGQRWEASALVDTGNQLKDPLSGTPVMVVELQLFASILPEEEYSTWKKIMESGAVGKLEDFRIWKQRWKVIPYRSAGQEMKWMFALRPDGVYLKEKQHESVPLLVGVDPYPLSGTNDFQMIIPAEALPESDASRSA
ncbi:sigma-E processing peptidase SpoIIGA [Salibacterium qingdaonense]|uniref:Sporulation sigma-E factor-processing peptidase n=1 Tax=Salibacterium qingdaonense TaxID=266892 RepID=A0A1I4IXC3_9BACI|nr:sigma-E processing peptidase SpoIIGA [Salibacterium qingdaonense]SFL59018.1 stage II sporulation protein GA (sporulation sigma-E factor processing peptidase) [Salibacterium qingdaonense]